MIKRLLSFLILTLAATSAQAQRVDQLPGHGGSSRAAAPIMSSEPMEERIAAVVNDGVLSLSDVRARLKLAVLSSGLPETDDIRQHLFPQVLRSLIDEQLQLQEGKRVGVHVSQEEIDNALRRLAADNNIPGGDMIAFLRANGVPPSTLVNQVRAVLTWNKVIQRTIRPRVDIGDDEIDAVVERLRANAGRQEYLVSEIYLAVDNPKDEDDVRKFSENLVAQIRNGANFGALARQFSQGSSAGAGGDIGWIQAGQLAAELDKTLQAMQSGEVAGPVRSASGYHILGVRDLRTIALGDPKEATIRIQQAFHSFASGQNKETLLKEAEIIRQTVTDCEDLSARLNKDFPQWQRQDLGDVKMASAPAWLVEKTRDIPVGRSSEAMATDTGALILFVCGRNMHENINRGEILNQIGMERMELLARRLLRDLRRNAHLDVRMALTQ